MNTTRLIRLLIGFILVSIANDSIVEGSDVCSQPYKGQATDDISESELACVKDPATVTTNWDFSVQFLITHCQRKMMGSGGKNWKPKSNKIQSTVCDTVGGTYDCVKRISASSPYMAKWEKSMANNQSCKLPGVTDAINALGQSGLQGLCPPKYANSKGEIIVEVDEDDPKSRGYVFFADCGLGPKK